jgi:hypothetical protein
VESGIGFRNFVQKFNLFSNTRSPKSRGSSVGRVTGYRLDDRIAGVRCTAEAGNFSFLHPVQTGSGANPASYTMGTAGCFPGVKQPGCEADDIKNAWPYGSTPIRLHGVVLS